jgi:hypothetical protein
MFDDGQRVLFDVTPYLECEAFRPLKEVAEFARVRNGGYYVEWGCGADLSADTLAAHLAHEMAISN